jgi:hypothetical protein
MENSTTQQQGTPAEESPETSQTGFWGFMHVTGTKILGVMDYVGETVVGILGLDDSKFQYVMDGMDTDDWEKAVAIDRERRLEDAIMDAAEELRAQDTQLQSEAGGDVEGGGSEAEEKKIKEYMNMVRDQVTADFWEKEIRETPQVEREIRQVVPDEVTPIVRTTDAVMSVEEVFVSVDNTGAGTSTTTSTTTTMSIEQSETTSTV